MLNLIHAGSSWRGPSGSFMLGGMAAASMLVASVTSRPEPDARYSGDLRDAPAPVAAPPAPAASSLSYVRGASRAIVVGNAPPRQQAARYSPAAARYGGEADAVAAVPVRAPPDADALRQTFDGAAASLAPAASPGAFVPGARLKPLGFSDVVGGGAATGGSGGAAGRNLPADSAGLVRAPAGQDAFAAAAAATRGPEQAAAKPTGTVVSGPTWSASAAASADPGAALPGAPAGASMEGRIAGNAPAAPNAYHPQPAAYQPDSAGVHGLSGNSPAAQAKPKDSEGAALAATACRSVAQSSSDAKTTVRMSSLVTKSVTVTTSGGAASSLIGATFEWERSQHLPIDGLTTTQRLSACGLIAAEALLRFVEKKPGLDDIIAIKNLAVAHDLWTSGQGMHGAVTEHELLTYMGVKTDLVPVGGSLSSTQQKMIGYLQEGKPVIVDTPRHYFFVEGYSGGKFFVGHTGEIMRGFDSSAGPEMNISHISYAGNGISSLIVPQ
ncbi:MAG: hypothetical protein NTX64_14860 [Elusimicrobia bacterium]|nr:hypothetical protein [Elusimicrobiota bacterium]